MAATLVLASASPRRLDLLRQVGLGTGLVDPADLDETPLPAEPPRDYALRMARAKFEAIAARHPGKFVLAADSVVAVGHRICPRPGRAAARASRSDVQAAVIACWVEWRSARGRGTAQVQTRLVETAVRFKRLEPAEIEEYVKSGEWRGKAGGYAIQGLAAKYVAFVSGSYSNVVGLPLHETAQMLKAMLR